MFSYVRVVTDYAEQLASQDLGLVCIVRDAEGRIHMRDADLALCKARADELGVGATVEVYCVIYRVTETSLSDTSYDLFND